MRCNAGVLPEYLTDQHLIAEYRELLIPFGQLRAQQFKTPPSPPTLTLGKGHILFWRDKQAYLRRRHNALVLEMKRRGFKPQYSFWDLKDIPIEFNGDWYPSNADTQILRQRILTKIALKPTWYRLNKTPILSYSTYEQFLLASPTGSI